MMRRGLYFRPARTGHPKKRARKHASWHEPGTPSRGEDLLRSGGGAAQGPQSVGTDAVVPAPEVVAGEVDVLPAERRDMGEQRAGDDLPPTAQDLQRAGEVDGVPQSDGGRDQGKAARPVLLQFGRAVAQPPEAMEADRTRERVARFALIELRCRLTAEPGRLQPGQGVQRALDASDLPQRQGQAVLPRVGAEA